MVPLCQRWQLLWLTWDCSWLEELYSPQRIFSPLFKWSRIRAPLSFKDLFLHIGLVLQSLKFWNLWSLGMQASIDFQWTGKITITPKNINRRSTNNTKVMTKWRIISSKGTWMRKRQVKYYSQWCKGQKLYKRVPN